MDAQLFRFILISYLRHLFYYYTSVINVCFVKTNKVNTFFGFNVPQGQVENYAFQDVMKSFMKPVDQYIAILNWHFYLIWTSKKLKETLKSLKKKKNFKKIFLRYNEL